MMYPLRTIALPVLAILTTGLLLLGSPATAAAHERRTIANGQAEAVVGWLNEPAYVDQPNAVSLTVTNAATKEPIAGLEKTVKVEVIKGGTTRTFDLRARFGQPGAYVADLVPTSTGDYSFRFFGEVNGTTINETFESGPGRFNSIQALTDVQFPAAQPGVSELQRQLADARSAADSARLLAIVGIGLGLLGLLAAGATLALRGRGAPTGQAQTIPGD